ncbi:MAG: hypothetical protein ACOC0P_01660, partial [Planctomycetota bacterium]
MTDTDPGHLPVLPSEVLEALGLRPPPDDTFAFAHHEPSRAWDEASTPRPPRVVLDDSSCGPGEPEGQRTTAVRPTVYADLTTGRGGHASLICRSLQCSMPVATDATVP